MLLQDVRDRLRPSVGDRNSPDGPIVSTDIFAGLVRTTIQLDLDDLIEPAIPQTYRPDGSHQFDNTGEEHNSIATLVEKTKF